MLRMDKAFIEFRGGERGEDRRDVGVTCRYGNQHGVPLRLPFVHEHQDGDVRIGEVVDKVDLTERPLRVGLDVLRRAATGAGRAHQREGGSRKLGQPPGVVHCCGVIGASADCQARRRSRGLCDDARE